MYRENSVVDSHIPPHYRNVREHVFTLTISGRVTRLLQISYRNSPEFSTMMVLRRWTGKSQQYLLEYARRSNQANTGLRHGHRSSSSLCALQLGGCGFDSYHKTPMSPYHFSASTIPF